MGSGAAGAAAAATVALIYSNLFQPEQRWQVAFRVVWCKHWQNILDFLDSAGETSGCSHVLTNPKLDELSHVVAW